MTLQRGTSISSSALCWFSYRKISLFPVAGLLPHTVSRLLQCLHHLVLGQVKIVKNKTPLCQKSRCPTTQNMSCVLLTLWLQCVHFNYYDTASKRPCQPCSSVLPAVFRRSRSAGLVSLNFPISKNSIWKYNNSDTAWKKITQFSVHIDTMYLFLSVLHNIKISDRQNTSQNLILFFPLEYSVSW